MLDTKDRPTFQDRYASAVNSSNLKSKPETPGTDVDVLGAMGIADRRLSGGLDERGERVGSEHPLAAPLQRLFVGDSGAANVIVKILAGIIRGKAQSLRIRMSDVQAADMARAMLGWFRHPTCRPCGGHGFKRIANTNRLSNLKCKPCNGTGRVLFEELYRFELRELVRWAMSQMEREVAMAGPAAMKALGPKLAL